MIRNTAHRRKAQQSDHSRRCNNMIDLLHRQMRQHNYNLSDQVCRCFINQSIVAKSRFVKIELFICPQSGVYQGIEFRPTIYFQADQVCVPPKVYNDRKVYHPNIDVFTNQLAVPELTDWNPSTSSIYLIRRIKYVIIQPNSTCVPNNPINRKACFLYLFSRQKLRSSVIQNCPTYLQEQVRNMQVMVDEKECKKFIDLKEFYPILKNKGHKEQQENTAFQLNLLCKKVKILKIQDQNAQQNTMIQQ